MSKKSKTSKKKHQFKHAAPASTTEVAKEAIIADKVAETKAGKAMGTTMALTLPGRDLSYVKKDLKKVLMVTSGLIVLELIFWYLLNHTAAGPAIYKLISV